MATVDDVRAIAMSLPRTSEHLIRDHVKFRVGRIVYASVSPDEERLGFGFPREERAALVASRPETFMMPLPSDERYQWVRARLAALDVDELRELLVDAWCMCVPKKVAASYQLVDVVMQIENGRVLQAAVSNHKSGMDGYESMALRIARQRRYSATTTGQETIRIKVGQAN